MKTLAGKLIENLIFFTTTGMRWEKDWSLLLDEFGNPFENINDAKKFVRDNMRESPFKVGLATFEQMRMNNAQWDNF